MSASDFNDMAALSGLDAVKQAITSAAASVVCEARDGKENATARDLGGQECASADISGADVALT